MRNTEEIWQKTLEIIKQEISEVGFNTWFSSVYDVSVSGNTLSFMVDGDFIKEIIETRYMRLLKNAVSFAAGEEFEIKILLPGETKKAEEVSAPLYDAGNLNSKYTFDTFVVGSSNSFAHAAAVAVAEAPAKKYNPLFIYGGVGLGKTHLSHAIGHHILRTNPESKVCYVTMDRFLDEFINSIKEENTEEFRNRYRNVDVLIIDDIQFIIKKERTQEEFFHTFNALFQANKQIIITSDRPPKEIATLEARLRSRFESGLICDIQSPDVETRIAIIENIVSGSNVLIPHDIIVFIAENIQSNIRELEGALNRIIALSELAKKEITLDLAREALKDFMFIGKKKIITTDEVIKEVARYFEVRPDEIRGKLKTKELSFYRQIGMYITRELTENSLPKIGEDFGGRDHTTVMHAIKKVSGIVKENINIKSAIDEIIGNICEK